MTPEQAEDRRERFELRQARRLARPAPQGKPERIKKAKRPPLKRQKAKEA